MENKKIKCLIVDDEAIAREVIADHISKIDSIEIVGSCKNALEAFNKIQNHEVNLIFLDINMPEISGLSLAKSINKNVKVIFTTAYREYAVDGFDLQAVDYLLKPISFERFLQAIQKYFDEHQLVEPTKIDEDSSTADDYIFVRSDRKMMKVLFSDIKFIESLSDYLKIHTNMGTLVTRETISNIEASLPLRCFLRTHRSYIVNLKKIDAFSADIINMEDHKIPISRSYRKEVLLKLNRGG